MIHDAELDRIDRYRIIGNDVHRCAEDIVHFIDLGDLVEFVYMDIERIQSHRLRSAGSERYQQGVLIIGGRIPFKIRHLSAIRCCPLDLDIIGAVDGHPEVADDQLHMESIHSGRYHIRDE